MGLSEWEVRQAMARGMERHASYLREAQTQALMDADTPRLHLRRRLMRQLDRMLTWLHIPHHSLS